MKVERKTNWWVAGILMGLIGLVLGALIAPFVMSGGGSRISKPMSDVSELSSAIDQFRIDCGRYPTNQEGFSVLFTAPKGLEGWNGPYLKGPIPDDPWNHPYIYRRPGQNGKTGYLVMSYGADGKPGGVDDDADIINGDDRD